MIEKMKKVCVVDLASKKDSMLESLRDLGVLHISDRKSAGREQAEKFTELSKALLLVKEYGKDTERSDKILSDQEFEELLGRVQAAADGIAKAAQQKGAALSELDRLAEWGDFDPQAVRELKKHGIDLHFFRFSKADYEKAAASEEVKLIPLADVGKMKAAAVIGELPEGIQASELVLPEKGVGQLQQEIAACEKKSEDCGAALKDAAAYEASFKDQILKAQNEEIMSSAQRTAAEDGDFVWLSGYIPEAEMDKFRAFASENHLAWSADDPSEEDEDVPTKVKYSKGSKIIEPLFDMLGILPGYREQDVSIWFLIFFTIFTAMIIGDAAYGLLFLILAVVLTVKNKKVNNVIFLIYVLAGATIVWGAITGTWFGSEAAMKIPLLRSLVIPNFANYPEYFGVTASTQQNTIMKFSFTLGVIQLALGCLLSARKKIMEKNLSFIADIGWLIAASAMYLLALYLVIGQSINVKPVFIAIIAAFLIVVLFGGMEPGKSFGQGLKAGLSGAFTVFLDTISCFGNVMSYIRLFAVGMASLAIAQSFNGIASGMKGPMTIAAVVVLLIGHGLNLIMGLLSVIVHGVRLNVLEFSGQAGLEWTGTAYKPFKKNSKIEN